MKLVLASKNAHKLDEMQAILGKFGVEVILQSELGLDIDVDETGTTFEENSELKARAVLEASGMPSIADDSGLEVDALDGQPGVYSHRFGNKDSDEERNYYLLDLMKDVPDEKRTARFVSVITCLFPDGKKIVARGGVIGLNLYPDFLSEGEADTDDILRHVDFALENLGEDALGFGFDIDGTDGKYPRGITASHSIHEQVIDLLLSHYSYSTVEKIAGLNVLDFLKNNLF